LQRCAVHPSFHYYFPKQRDDLDPETRRYAVWGVGYHSISSGMEKLRSFFEDNELRMDALFSYAMTLPSEVPPARMKAMYQDLKRTSRAEQRGENPRHRSAVLF
jgi:hypothetical protein